MAEPVGDYESRRLACDEALPKGATILDFWRWIGSDLVGNTTRGLFAEYLVGLAVGAVTGEEADGVRDEWAAHDLVIPGGITIEVKSSAYLQSWWQEKETTPRFGIAPTQGWDSATGSYSKGKARHSHVYVFCLLGHRREKARLDPLDLSQWSFYVLAAAVLDESVKEQKDIGVGPLMKLGAKEVSFDQIAAAVRKAGAPSTRSRVS